MLPYRPNCYLRRKVRMIKYKCRRTSIGNLHWMVKLLKNLQDLLFSNFLPVWCNRKWHMQIGPVSGKVSSDERIMSKGQQAGWNTEVLGDGKSHMSIVVSEYVSDTVQCKATRQHHIVVAARKVPKRVRRDRKTGQV